MEADPQPFMPGQKIKYQDAEDYLEPIDGFIEMIMGNGDLVIQLDNGKWVEVSITYFTN